MVTSNISRTRVLFLVALMFFFLMPGSVNEAKGAEDNGIKIYINGTQQNSDVSPFIDENSRTMVPLRFIAESMGAYVDWSMGTQVITIKHNGSVITLSIGSNKGVADGKTVSLDTQPVIKDTRTMVPLRFVTEQLGCVVSWNIKEQAVYIKTAGAGDQNSGGNDAGNVKEEVVVNVSSYGNIRQGPGTAYPVVSKVQNGTVLGSVGSSGGWYQVLLADNSTGWISGTIVKLKGEEQNNNDDEDNNSEEDNGADFVIDGDSVIFISAGVNIRSAASAGSAIIGQANKGEELAAIGQEADWIMVKTKDGQKGYVANWLVAFKKAPDVKNGLLSGRTIVIDPGHGSLQSGGGSDPGAVSPSGIYEKNVVSKIAAAAGEVLSENGATVVYTRIGNSTSITLDGRAALANNLGADVFVAIHCNASTTAAGSGTSTYYYVPGTINQQQGLARERLATKVQEALVNALGRKNLGILTANFAVLRCTTVPSILVETAFLSNPEEEALLRTSAFQQQAGEAIAKGLIAYFQ